MGKVKIPKKITLGFLGDEYKEGYLKFNSIPAKKYKDIISKINSLDNESVEVESIDLVLELLKDNFIEGKFPDVENDGKLQDLTVKDLEDFDVETLTRSFELLSGANPDPK